jgi:hypothetical protein
MTPEIHVSFPRRRRLIVFIIDHAGAGLFQEDFVSHGEDRHAE